MVRQHIIALLFLLLILPHNSIIWFLIKLGHPSNYRLQNTSNIHDFQLLSYGQQQVQDNLKQILKEHLSLAFDNEFILFTCTRHEFNDRIYVQDYELSEVRLAVGHFKFAKDFLEALQTINYNFA
jgi:hypothetical protein